MADDIKAYLRADEKVIWTGRPQQGLRLSARDTLLIPFSLVWAGFAVFWESSVFSTGAPSFFMLWGGMFVLVGLYLVVGRFLHDAYFRSRTSYAVTDKRVLIARHGMMADLVTLDIRRLEQVRFKPEGGGRGTIVFGPEISLFGRRGFGQRGGMLGPWVESASGVPQFTGIVDAVRVLNQIEGLRTVSSDY